MELNSLEDLLTHLIQDLYDAEQQITHTLPKIIKAATTPELQAALENHLEETENQIQRLEAVCKELNISPKGKKCKAMKGLLEEGGEMLKEKAQPIVLDAGIIISCQRVEHYEIASYGSAIALATHLGQEEVLSLLEESLAEEKAADEKLTELAEGYINAEAANEDEDERMMVRE